MTKKKRLQREINKSNKALKSLGVDELDDLFLRHYLKGKIYAYEYAISLLDTETRKRRYKGHR